MSLSERIKIAMDLAGVSQVELARACGVKPPSVHGWLSGKSKFLRGENLLQAARVLNVSQDWLATGTGPMHPAPAQSADGDRQPTAIGQLASLTSVEAQTAGEMRLLAVYRLTDDDGRNALDALIETLARRLDAAREGKHAA